MSRRHVLAAALSGAAVTAAALVSAAPASAAGPLYPYDSRYVGVRAPVCAEDIEVRSSPGGPAIAHLVKNQTIAIDQVTTEWVHGFAYGDANTPGWIQNGWFCGP